MVESIRYFNCAMPNCHSLTPFDLNKVSKPLSNKIKCSKCGKEWAASVTNSCCSINIKFVSIEFGNRKPMVFIQSFTKH